MHYKSCCDAYCSDELQAVPASALINNRHDHALVFTVGDERHSQAVAMPPLFTLVDCNNFYASCERVFNAGISHPPIVVHCMPSGVPPFS
jgi:hypothetical protein